mmetsp:Transcript_20329/g.54306  ORF Transcript_20329/g.54306 Transcript_20329/m.54306 type:complete len:254 (+) Transcript_20329:1261-2022(+)
MSAPSMVKHVIPSWPASTEKECLLCSKRMACSPKCPPRPSLASSTVPDGSLLLITHVPSFRMYHCSSSHSWSWWSTRSPGRKVTYPFAFLASSSLSKLRSGASNGTSPNRSRHSWTDLWQRPKLSLKCSCVITKTFESFVACTVPMRRVLYSSASSPKHSPELYLASSLDSTTGFRQSTSTCSVRSRNSTVTMPADTCDVSITFPTVSRLGPSPCGTRTRAPTLTSCDPSCSKIVFLLSDIARARKNCLLLWV